MIIDTSAVLAILFDEDDGGAGASRVRLRYRDRADRPMRCSRHPRAERPFPKLRYRPLLYKGNDFSQTDIASALE